MKKKFNLAITTQGNDAQEVEGGGEIRHGLFHLSPPSNNDEERNKILNSRYDPTTFNTSLPIPKFLS